MTRAEQIEHIVTRSAEIFGIEWQKVYHLNGHGNASKARALIMMCALEMWGDAAQDYLKMSWEQKRKSLNIALNNGLELKPHYTQIMNELRLKQAA